MSRSSLRPERVLSATFALIALSIGGALVWSRIHPDRISQARDSYKRGEWERAADLLRGEWKGDAIKSADEESVRFYARTLARSGRDSAASKLYEGRLAKAELATEDVFLKGLVMARTGRPEAALETWGRSVGRGVDHPELLDHFSRLSARYQRLDPALDAARRLSRLPGSEAKGGFILGQLADLVDDPPGVVMALEDALRRNPEAREALFDADHYRKLLARNLLRLGRAVEAEAQLKAARPDEPIGGVTKAGSSSAGPDEESQWLLSRAYLQQNRMAEAAVALVRSNSYGAEHRLMPEPSPYVGSAACRSCHPDETLDYEATRHTRTFYHRDGLLSLPLPDRPVPDPDDPEVLHTITRKGNHIETSSRIGDSVSRMVVRYAFGTPERYLTMIARDQQQTFRALRVSHFQTRTKSGWGATAGDVGHSDAPEDRLGQPIDIRDGVVRCLYCHVTRSRDFRDPPQAGGPTPASADRGIGCERCHGPGAHHLRAVAREFKDSRGSTDLAIINVAGTPAATANGQCVECHTVGLSFEIEKTPDDPKYVRSPGVTFPASRCFIESGGTMSCMTCHDPHREAEHSATFYETKCLSCHSSVAPTGNAGPGRPPGGGKPCPVNPSRDCLACHMPRVPMPTLHTELTDHYIRVHRELANRATP